MSANSEDLPTLEDDEGWPPVKMRDQTFVVQEGAASLLRPPGRGLDTASGTAPDELSTASESMPRSVLADPEPTTSEPDGGGSSFMFDMSSEYMSAGQLPFFFVTINVETETANPLESSAG